MASPMRGILLVLAAIFLFAVMASLIKAATRIPAGEAVFFRAFCALPVIVAWLAARRELGAGLRVQRWQNHAVRAIAGTTAMALGFVGLKMIPLPEATAIRFVTPILVVIFAAIVLGERFRLIRASAVLVGLAGVMIITWPKLTLDIGDQALIGSLATLASAALAALAQIFVKAMSGTERTTAIVFWFSATAAGLSLLSLPFGWVMPQGHEWALLIGAGLVGGLGQILLTASYRYADVSTLAPFTYASMIWALLIGYFIFDEAPTVSMLLGAALVIAAGVAIVLREQQLGHQRAAEGKLRAHDLK